VRYEVTAPLAGASYCHCKGCQRRSGAAASPRAHPAEGTFRIVAGENRLRVWTSEQGGDKWFCGDCGSQIYGNNPAHPIRSACAWGRSTRIPGSGPPLASSCAAAWEPIPDDGLPRFPESRHAG
jgi:hypothetical protein